MDKTSKKIIQEAIKDIIEYRNEELDELFKVSFVKDQSLIKKNVNPMYHNARTLTKYYKTIIKLNNLLNVDEKINIAEEMEKIQAKKYITVKEFEEIYNISSSSQKGLRGRINDPLPFTQKRDLNGKRISGAKIIYDVNEIEKWMDNNYR